MTVKRRRSLYVSNEGHEVYFEARMMTDQEVEQWIDETRKALIRQLPKGDWDVWCESYVGDKLTQ